MSYQVLLRGSKGEKTRPIQQKWEEKKNHWNITTGIWRKGSRNGDNCFAWSLKIKDFFNIIDLSLTFIGYGEI